MKKQNHQLLLSTVLKPLNLGKCISANFWTLFLIITFLEIMSVLSAYFHFSKMPKLYDSANALERISCFYLNTSSSENTPFAPYIFILSKMMHPLGWRVEHLKAILEILERHKRLFPYLDTCLIHINTFYAALQNGYLKPLILILNYN